MDVGLTQQLCAGASSLLGVVQQALQDLGTCIAVQAGLAQPEAPLQAASLLLLLSHLLKGAAPSWQPAGLESSCGRKSAGMHSLWLAGVGSG